MTGSISGWGKLVVKRFLFGVKIKHICNKKNFKLKTNGFLWWLGKNKSGKCNFTVTCPDERFCVKLIGVRSRKILYGFVDETSYEIKDYTFALPVTMDAFEYEIRKKEPYRFEAGTTHCIVMVPDSVKVTVRSETVQARRIEIGSHDKTHEGEFFIAEKFLSMLKEK